ncbi:MAG: PAS domain-containing protein [Deltaproteobacteria bacterium]|nr:PAS domain-containing protein [Myxococcales bacterium]MDP3220116.1 PAS domain-containing protein [Deltaproteobacteria bacterium]
MQRGGYFVGGGVAGALLRSIDWSTTPLGAIESWPVSLKCAVGTVLHARHPMFLWWGEELIQFYNDAYIPSFGEGKHPAAMGQRARDCWGETWPIIWPQIDDVMTRGKGSWNEDALVPILRNGAIEDVYWTYGYSPVFDDEGRIGGVLVTCTETTARVVAERALRASEARYRRLMEELPEPVLVHVDGAIAYANAASAQGFGLASSSELIGRSIVEFAALGTGARIEARMERVRGGEGRLEVAEQSFVRQSDGREIHAEVKTVPIDYEGRPAMLSIARDITARVEAERERERLAASLEFERRRLGNLLQNAPAFIAVLRGPQHVFELVNEAFYDLVGTRDLLGRPLAEAMPEVMAQGFGQILDGVLATGEPFVGTGLPVVVRRGPGEATETRFVNFVYQALVEEDGSRSGVFIHGIDVTDETLVQRRVRAQFNGAPVPTYVWQRVERRGVRELVLVDFNDATMSLTQGGITQCLGQTAAEFLLPGTGILEDLERCLATGVTFQRELDHVQRTGERKRLLITYACAPPDMVLAHTEDVTARRRTEEQLRQAQKMDAVGRLAGGVAHDFNNMLSVILGNAHLLLPSLPPGDPRREDVEEILDAAGRSAELTRQLLAFARRQPIAPRVIDLNETVGRLLKLLRRLIGEDIELVWKPGPGLGHVMMDGAQLDQVLANLAVNARDAIAGVGRVVIETGNVTFDQAWCEANASHQTGDFVQISVSDSGCGMDQATQAKLFEPFFTTREFGKGTGLGLATVYGIVQQNGGFINVYSEVGLGSTFRIYLPRCAAPGARPLERSAVDALPRGAETVLIVEDEVALLRLTRRLLEALGYTVLATADAREALALAESATIDLLITDVIMPLMSGREVYESLRASRPGLRCLYTSGYTAEVITHHGVLEAGVHFLEKPFTREALAFKVREALGR